jgi:hypothetical protein
MRRKLVAASRDRGVFVVVVVFVEKDGALLAPAAGAAVLVAAGLLAFRRFPGQDLLLAASLVSR